MQDSGTAYALYAEEELDELHWQSLAPYIESTSYLVKDDGSNCLNAIGKEVVFVKEGYFEQCRVIQQPQTDPSWSSFALRQWSRLHPHASKADWQISRLSSCLLGLVERCRVTKLTYHRRILPDVQPDSAQPTTVPTIWDTRTIPPRESAQESSRTSFAGQEPSSSHAWPPASDIVQPVDAGRMGNLPLRSGSAAPSSSQSSDESDARTLNSRDDSLHSEESDESSDEEEGDLGQFFVRVTLQRLPQRRDRLGAVFTVIDHYLDCGVGEWLIPRKRYDLTESRRWRKGERIQMYWADKTSTGRGQWWEGKIQGYVSRPAEDPFRSSPWASVIVKWSETDTKDNISPWELEHAQDIFREDEDSGSEFETLYRLRSVDEEEREDLEAERLPRTLSHERPRQAESDSDNDSDYGERPTKRSRTLKTSESLGPLPVTMTRVVGTVDWNAGYCAICRNEPDGRTVIECDGTCFRSFHQECIPAEEQPKNDDAGESRWYCMDCRLGLALCAECKVKGKAGCDMLKCRVGGCGNHFHPDCARRIASSNPCLKIVRDDGLLSLVNKSKTAMAFICPRHRCDRCHVSGDAIRIFHCWKCLVAKHSKCMEEGDRRFNDREMECRDCAFRTGKGAQDTKVAGQADPAVNVWYPEDQAAASVPMHKTLIPCLHDLQAKRRVPLTGKAIFHFGSHTRGGGCDFIVPLQNVKFHTELRIDHSGSVSVRYCHNKAKEIAALKVKRGEDCEFTLLAKETKALYPGDIISIGETHFQLEIDQQSALPVAGSCAVQNSKPLNPDLFLI